MVRTLAFRNEGQGFESRMGMKVTQEFEGALKTYYADVKQIVYLCSSHSSKWFLRHTQSQSQTGASARTPEKISNEKVKYRKRKIRRNRSPKGNMWSVIPVALLCMIVIWS